MNFSNTREKGLEALIVRYMAGEVRLAVTLEPVAENPDPADAGFFVVSAKDYNCAYPRPRLANEIKPRQGMK